MGKRITKLEVHEVSLVRRGANPGAKVLLIKSRAGGLLNAAKKALGFTTRKALESAEQLEAYGALRAAFLEAGLAAAEAGDAETLKTSVDEFLAAAAALDASAKLPPAETFIAGGEDAAARMAAVNAGVAAVQDALGIEVQAEPELEEEDMTKPADADGILKQKDVEIAALKAELAKSRKEGEALETRLGELAGKFTALEQASLRKSLAAEVSGYAHDGLTADETVEALMAPKPEHVRKLLSAATAKSGEMSALFKAHGFRGVHQDAPQPVSKLVDERAEQLLKSNPALPPAVARSQALQSLTPEQRDAFNQERA